MRFWMTGGRCFAVLLLALGLVACDSGRDPAPGPQPPSVAQPAAEAVQPAAAPTQPSVPLPAAAGEVEHRPPLRLEPAPHGGAQHKAVERHRPAVVKSAAPQPLDLSPPGDAAEDLAGAGAGAAPLGEPQALLPPLFAPRDKAASGNVQMAGRLLTNPRSTAGKDYWETVEGAELQLQFRR
ncbi:MAG TPA: hypothetical protein VER09_01315 [Pseudomonas sp.]|nr:hypothetical protein [Pseudomonas sp.]